jgi:type I restriction enzyme S subunit
MSELNNIPKHWQIKKLREVCTYSKGKMPQVLEEEKSKDCFIPYINIRAFEKGIFAEYTDGVKCNLCNDGDLLMVWDGARCGLIGKAKKGAVGSTLMKILPTENIHREYLYYFISSKFHTLNMKPKGVGIPHIEPTLLWNFELVVPPFPEQQAIVSKIEELLSDLENGKQQLLTAQQQLKVYRQSLLKASFEGKLTSATSAFRQAQCPSVSDKQAVVEPVDPVVEPVETTAKKDSLPKGDVLSLPKGWKWVKLGDVCYNVEYGSATKSKKVGKVPVLRMGNIQNGKFDWDDLVFTDNNEEIEKYLLKKNDILFNRTNSAELVGKTAIYKGERPAIFAGYLIRINRIESLIDATYLTYFLNTHFAKSYGNSVRSFGVNQSNINGTKLKTYPIPLCPLEEQQLIVSELESKLTVCDKIEETISQSLQKAETLRQSILKKAFEGKLINYELKITNYE